MVEMRSELVCQVKLIILSIYYNFTGLARNWRIPTWCNQSISL